MYVFYKKNLRYAYKYCNFNKTVQAVNNNKNTELKLPQEDTNIHTYCINMHMHRYRYIYNAYDCLYTLYNSLFRLLAYILF